MKLLPGPVLSPNDLEESNLDMVNQENSTPRPELPFNLGPTVILSVNIKSRCSITYLDVHFVSSNLKPHPHYWKADDPDSSPR